MPKGYVILTEKVTDPEGMKAYGRAAGAAMGNVRVLAVDANAGQLRLRVRSSGLGWLPLRGRAPPPGARRPGPRPCRPFRCGRHARVLARPARRPAVRTQAARSQGLRFTAPYVLIEGSYLAPGDSALRDNAEVDRTGNRVAVSQGSAHMLAVVPGIGRKKAERLIVELKDKIGRLEAVAGRPGVSPHDRVIDDAVRALISLGYTHSEAQKAIHAALQRIGTPGDVEKLIREALKPA